MGKSGEGREERGCRERESNREGEREGTHRKREREIRDTHKESV